MATAPVALVASVVYRGVGPAAPLRLPLLVARRMLALVLMLVGVAVLLGATVLVSPPLSLAAAAALALGLGLVAAAVLARRSCWWRT